MLLHVFADLQDKNYRFVDKEFFHYEPPKKVFKREVKELTFQAATVYGQMLEIIFRAFERTFKEFDANLEESQVTTEDDELELR